MMSVTRSTWATGSSGPSTGSNRSDSGIGREGGRHSREFFTEAKTVVMEI